MTTKNNAVSYAEKVIAGEAVAPKYVRKQCAEFLKIWNDEHPKYCINKKTANLISKILKMLIMPKGLKAGQTLYECSTGYQWVFYVSVLCVVHRDNEERRRYETAILEIARKNFKTYTIATVFILLFLLEPKFSKFFSVAPDGSLSKEVREAIAETIKSSPLIFQHKEKKRWKILRDYISFLPKETKFFPLAYTNSTFDGKLPNVFLADEVGALPNNSAIESMRSGQINILNKLGCIISTKYPTIDNPLETEVNYAKQVLDGIVEDDTVFALLYEPDEVKDWITDDNILKQANPVAQEIDEIWQDLLKKRAYAIAVESARENFLTKHCNIIYQGAGTETYIDVNDVKKCRVAKIDWQGRQVYLGVDLSMTNDNTSIAMASVDDDDNILADVIAFVPDGRVAEKNKFEKINYNEFINAMKCIACGDKTIDYKAVEDFVFAIEEKYGVAIMGIAFDRYNALSSAQKWAEKYNTIEVRQHSSVLHAPTKLLFEKITNGEFKYEKNTLLEINFQNARCTFDTNLNRYVNKKKSSGKVDMVVSLINAVYLLQQDYFLNQGQSFELQGI
jgi:phage terminase large subunit-like protein